MVNNPKEYAAIYNDALLRLEYSSKIDVDDDVIFKVPEFGTLYFSLDAEHDPEYFRLIFPNFADQKSVESDSDKMIAAINKTNMSSKLVKLYVRENNGQYNVSAIIEGIIAATNQAPSRELVASIMPRLMSAMRSGVTNFVNEIKRNADTI